MVCSQYLVSALRTSHPSHSIVTQPSGHPIKKDTLKFRFLPSIANYLSNGSILAHEYEAVCKDIHQTTVQSAILNLPLNNVLQDHPPTIDPVEKNGARTFRRKIFRRRTFRRKVFRRTEFSPYGFFAVRIFRRMNFRRTEFSPYTYLGSSSLVNVFSIRNTAVGLLLSFTHFLVILWQQLFFYFLEVKFPINFSATLEST